MTKKYKDDTSRFIHSAAEGMFKAGGLTKKEMVEFDEMCLVKEDKADSE